MRILYLASKFAPELGGLQQFNLMASQLLAQRGHELVLATWTPAEQEDRKWPFPVYRLERGHHHRPHPVEPLSKILKTFSPNLVFISHTSRRLRLLYPFLDKKKIPIIGYCHQMNPSNRNRGTIRRFLLRRRYGFDRIPLVLTNSQVLKDSLEGVGVPKDRMQIIPPGFDPKHFRKDSALREKTRKGLEVEGKLVLLTVSRLIKAKGHERVLRVMPRLLDQFPNLLYWIVGDGSYRENLEQQTKDLKLQEHVRFLGAQKDPAAFYNAADLFVHPSNLRGKWVETFGLSILEAAACELPAIASRESGAREIIEHGKTGFLIDEDNEEELRESMRSSLAEEKKRHQMGEAARIRVNSLLTWDRCINGLESVLRSRALG